MLRKITDKRIYYRSVYLNTQHWKCLKKDKLKITPRCEKCGTQTYLDVHHTTYKNLYDVNVSDLITLCRKCHTDVHLNLNKETYKKFKQKRKKEFRRKKRFAVKQVSKILGLSKKTIYNLLMHP